MMLSNRYPYSRLIKLFTDLGPYIREEKCKETIFFFDCLVICVNANLALENREFWGWWMQLEAQEDHFAYEYYFGLFDRYGNWKVSIIKGKENNEKVENTLRNFHGRLNTTLQDLKLTLKPAVGFKNKYLK